MIVFIQASIPWEKVIMAKKNGKKEKKIMKKIEATNIVVSQV